MAEEVGYDETLFLVPDEIKDFTCPICLDVIRDCVETATCGHLFCESCIRSHLKNSTECPLDHENVSLKDLTPIKSLRRKILSCKVRCPNAEDTTNSNHEADNPDAINSTNAADVSCKWTGCLRDLECHTDSECVLREVVCLYEQYGCTVKMKPHLMYDHLENTKHHLALVEQFVELIQNENKLLKDELSTEKQKNSDLSAKLAMDPPAAHNHPHPNVKNIDAGADMKVEADKQVVHSQNVYSAVCSAIVADILDAEDMDKILEWEFNGTTDEVNCYRKQIGEKQFVKGIGIIQAPPMSLLALAMRVDLKPHWDKMMEMGAIIERVDNHTEIHLEKYNAVWPSRSRDFVLLCHWQLLDDGGAIMVKRSINYDLYPPKRSAVRGDHIGGFVFRPLKAGNTLFTYIEWSELKGYLPSYLVRKVSELWPLTVANIRQYQKVVDMKDINVDRFFK